jgi:hypothetical protein
MPCLKRWAGVGDWRESHRCFRFLRCDYRQCAGSTGPSVFADQSDQGTVLEFRYQRDCGRTADGDDHPAVLEAIGDGGLCREGLNPRSGLDCHGRDGHGRDLDVPAAFRSKLLNRPKPADAPFLAVSWIRAKRQSSWINKALQSHVSLRLAKLPFINAPCNVYHYFTGFVARVAW